VPLHCIRYAANVWFSEKVKKASYNVAELITKAKKTSRCRPVIISAGLNKNGANCSGSGSCCEISKVSLSPSAVICRVNDMSGDTELSLKEKLILSKKFSLQIDKSTDIGDHAEFVGNVRYIDSDYTTKNFFGKGLPK
jgi:hypothetical protein